MEHRSISVRQALTTDCHITSRPAERGGGGRGQLRNCVYSVISSLFVMCIIRAILHDCYQFLSPCIKLHLTLMTES